MLKKLRILIDNLLKNYKYDSITFSGNENDLNTKIKNWLKSNPQVIPVNTSMCMSHISTILVAVIIYKY